MKTSPAGRTLIEEREGRRLVAYRDTKGILTIGVGHTGRMSPPPVTAGMRITEAECDTMLASDLAPVEGVLNRALKVPVTQNEFDAMASLGFNIGAAGLERSSVVRRLNLGDVAGAAQAFMMWSRPAVLAARRVAERKQFLAPTAPDGSDAGGAGVAAARADVLAGRAALAKAKARSAATNGAAVAGAGTAATAIAAQGHHAHLAWVVGVVVAGGAALNGLISWSRHHAAGDLAANAAREADKASVHPLV